INGKDYLINHLGLEYLLNNKNIIRSGFSQEVLNDVVYAVYTLGYGYSFNENWAIDYAFSFGDKTEIGTTHYLTGTYFFTEKSYFNLTRPEKEITVEGPTCKITGTSKKIRNIWINDFPVYLKDAGDFEFLLPLEIGKNTVVIKYEDYSGKESTLKQTIIRKVKDSENFQQQIAILVRLGYFPLYHEDYFRPSEIVSKAEFIYWLYKDDDRLQAMELPLNSNYSDIFSDYWIRPYIELAYRDGIVVGHQNHTFSRFRDNITVWEAAAILARYYKLATIKETSSEVKKWFPKIAQLLEKENLMPPELLNQPYKRIQRSESIKILLNLDFVKHQMKELESRENNPK
ncbi:MAG: hypothetical protein KKA19_01350, partial [Candidatus Margulisbacteria bacterium]|nr:hypothetical protein [Candidatus Margulisiibacteriota bacterium]